MIKKAVIFDLTGVFMGRRITVAELERMAALLVELKNSGLRLYILSNLAAASAEIFERDHPYLAEMFDGAYYSGITGFEKPDKRAFDMVLKAGNLKEKHCVFFDDTPGHVEAAIKMGIESYPFEGAEAAREVLVKAGVLKA